MKEKLIFPDQDFLNIKYREIIIPIPKVYNYMISVAEINPNYIKENRPILIHYVMEKPWSIKFPYKTDHPYFKCLWQHNQRMKVIKTLDFTQIISYISTHTSVKGRKTNMIPKIIHYCWFGESKIPPLIQKMYQIMEKTSARL